jgi:hypothetical protein
MLRAFSAYRTSECTRSLRTKRNVAEETVLISEVRPGGGARSSKRIVIHPETSNCAAVGGGDQA